MPMNKLLEAQNITFKYFENDKKNVLNTVDLSLDEGTITLLHGKSGCGKSTLAYILAGLYPENSGILISGSVMVDGVNIHELSARERVKYIGMMFQNCDLQFCMDTLRNELLFCGENIDEEIDTERLSNRVGIYHLLDRNFHTLSGGEKQKCALCCILALGSRVVILDEAFANIDMKAAAELISILKKSGLTILAIDHNIDLWEGVCHKKILLGESHMELALPPRNINITEDVVLKTNDLWVNEIKYPNLCIKKGSITAIMGQSGAGKTTLFKTIIGQYKYDGSILMQAKEIKKIKHHILYSKCGLVFQNPSNQFVAMTVYDEVLFSIRRWWHGEENKQLGSKISEQKSFDGKTLQEKTMELLTDFGLENKAKYPPYMLSQGQQRRLAVLAMIAGNQQLLLLDEPTYGQDYPNICAMMGIINAKANQGLTVIFSTHNEQVAKEFADEIIEIGGEK